MSVNWSVSEDRNPFVAEESASGLVFHAAESTAVDDVAVKDAVEAALERAVACLDANVKNESLYFMVEWAPSRSVLRLAVTDAGKVQDSPEVVVCQFPALNAVLQQAEDVPARLEAFSDKVSFWAKDYLSTSSEFMNYSLVALFVTTVRAEGVLL